MPRFLEGITFIDGSGEEVVINGKVPLQRTTSSIDGPSTYNTLPLRDNTNRFQVGNTDVSSTDGYIVINKNYVDGRISTVNQTISAEVTARQNKDSFLEAKISAEVTARQNAINALDKSDSAVAGQFVSAVSETNGIISVSRRAIVDSDGVVLKTGDQTITGTKTFKSVNFINFKDPEGRTNTALPNVCSINMGDDTTLFDCDAAGRIGLIGRDDPNTPGQNPSHTTGIRFFRSSSDDTVPSDYGDFYYNSGNNQFWMTKSLVLASSSDLVTRDIYFTSGGDSLLTRLNSLGFKSGSLKDSSNNTIATLTRIGHYVLVNCSRFGISTSFVGNDGSTLDDFKPVTDRINTIRLPVYYGFDNDATVTVNCKMSNAGILSISRSISGLGDWDFGSTTISATFGYDIRD